jgi:hypothetical protein
MEKQKDGETFPLKIGQIKLSKKVLKLHKKTQMPKRRTKKNPLTKEDKCNNQYLARERSINENVIGLLKRFKILSDRYRNRRKRFCLRFNLIAGIYNWEL